MIKLQGKSLTQFEVAAKLGISRGTLNRVLSGSPLVKPATRKRIEAALDRLGYKPNFMAQGLRTGRTKTIGLISLGDGKSSEIDKFRAICEAARLKGYSVLLTYSDGTADGEIRCINELRARHVDGFIISSNIASAESPHLHKLVKSRLPMIITPPAVGLDSDTIYVDVRAGFRRLTEHFISLGHKSIGLLILKTDKSFVVREREAGFREAMKAAKLPVNEDFVIRASHDMEPDEKIVMGNLKLRNRSGYRLGYRGAQALFALKKRPTAVLCQSDQTAVGFLHAARLAHVDVPGDIAITGYDDLRSSAFARVPLTTMHQPEVDYGFAAMELLLRRIDGDWSDFPRTHSITPELVIRESCGSQSVSR